MICSKTRQGTTWTQVKPENSAIKAGLGPACPSFWSLLSHLDPSPRSSGLSRAWTTYDQLFLPPKPFFCNFPIFSHTQIPPLSPNANFSPVCCSWTLVETSASVSSVLSSRLLCPGPSPQSSWKGLERWKVFSRGGGYQAPNRPIQERNTT